MRGVKLFFIIFLFLTFLSAQEKEQERTEWTIEKVSDYQAIAKWSIKNHSLEEVYKALMQNLIMMNKTTADGDPFSGIITAHKPGLLIKFVINATESGVDLIGKSEFVRGEKASFSTPFSQAKKFFNELFPKVKEYLNK